MVKQKRDVFGKDTLFDISLLVYREWKPHLFIGFFIVSIVAFMVTVFLHIPNESDSSVMKEKLDASVEDALFDIGPTSIPEWKKLLYMELFLFFGFSVIAFLLLEIFVISVKSERSLR